MFQVGYRSRMASVLTWSLTAFRHDWDKLRSGTAPPVVIENRIEGPAYGVEAWASWQALSAWRLSGGLTTLRKDLRLESGSTDMVGTNNPQLSNDPDQQWMLRSSLNFWTSHDLDAMVRRVGTLPHPRCTGIHGGRPALRVARAAGPGAVGKRAEPLRSQPSRVQRLARPKRIQAGRPSAGEMVALNLTADTGHQASIR